MDLYCFKVPIKIQAATAHKQGRKHSPRIIKKVQPNFLGIFVTPASHILLSILEEVPKNSRAVTHIFSEDSNSRGQGSRRVRSTKTYKRHKLKLRQSVRGQGKS